MMLVPVRVDRSPIEGLGLFAVDPIPAGTPVWRFDPLFDRRFDATTFARLPAQALAHVRHFGYLDAADGCWVLNGDLAIFMNHAATPNTGAPGSTAAADETVALRDIAAGEELTCDYARFDAAGKPVR